MILKMTKLALPVLIGAILLFSCNGAPQKEEQKAPEETVVALDEYIVAYFADSVTVREKHFVVNRDSNIVKAQRFHPNGELAIEGLLKSDKQHGLWKAWAENGAIQSSGNYIGGVEEGWRTAYFPNGNIRFEGNVVNEEPEGVWKFYNNDGTLNKTEEYDLKN